MLDQFILRLMNHKKFITNKIMLVHANKPFIKILLHIKMEHISILQAL